MDDKYNLEFNFSLCFLEPLSSTMQVPGWILFNIQVNLQNKLAIEGHSHDRPKHYQSQSSLQEEKVVLILL